MMAGFRYVTPVEPPAATGRVAQVYAQFADEVGMARMPIFLTLSPAPEVLAATWATLRESLLTGNAPRTGKELVALGVSMVNKCPFCVAAHTTFLHATGDHRLGEAVAGGGAPADPAQARLLAWAKARDGGVPRPFAAKLAPEYVGTALAFHFINRMVSALLTENLLPANLQNSRLVRSLGGLTLARKTRRRTAPGRSLPLIAGLPALPEPAWGAGTPAGAAYAVLGAVAGAGADLLGEAARAAVAGAVGAWDGSHPPMGGDWLDRPLAGLPAGERAGARIALLVALAPYRLTDADVAAWRDSSPSMTDEDLVRLCAFGAMRGTERTAVLIGESSTTTETPTSGDRS
ncbi:carboxymuconolactone decarboxylase family protein [Nonomuraea jiangxiensis]|uniref:Alkylhydroperoxidase AhpD family core domain-containing protein n=1 Tax=Nonomuraea jiangxiensis TaxID=633440 RepID=A0A1G8Y508_9ACTN|nr:carboxymuconolactone decarboxylase family protein [Nonomuraea jiangxiensis]SDJ97727.1 alkylhydroperoxidase AhpD family core domain-containing protein [Nonomuraea jiangxiensis]